MRTANLLGNTFQDVLLHFKSLENMAIVPAQKELKGLANLREAKTFLSLLSEEHYEDKVILTIGSIKARRYFFMYSRGKFDYIRITSRGIEQSAVVRLGTYKVFLVSAKNIESVNKLLLTYRLEKSNPLHEVINTHLRDISLFIVFDTTKKTNMEGVCNNLFKTIPQSKRAVFVGTNLAKVYTRPGEVLFC